MSKSRRRMSTLLQHIIEADEQRWAELAGLLAMPNAPRPVLLQRAISEIRRLHSLEHPRAEVEVVTNWSGYVRSIDMKPGYLAQRMEMYRAMVAKEKHK